MSRESFDHFGRGGQTHTRTHMPTHTRVHASLLHAPTLTGAPTHTRTPGCGLRYNPHPNFTSPNLHPKFLPCLALTDKRAHTHTRGSPHAYTDPSPTRTHQSQSERAHTGLTMAAFIHQIKDSPPKKSSVLIRSHTNTHAYTPTPIHTHVHGSLPHAHTPTLIRTHTREPHNRHFCCR